MKTFYCIMTVLLLTNYNGYSQSPVYGEAVIFTYDLSGNRTLRTYDPNTTINYKVGSIEPVDTLTQNVNSNTKTIKIYPNPVEDFVTINNLSWSVDDNAVAQVFDVTGKFISTQKVNTAIVQVKLSNVTPGTYIVNYHLNGMILSSWRIIKR